MKNLRILLILVMTAIVCGVTASAVNDADQTRRKARHYYFEGNRMLVTGRIPEAYELFRRAAETDPTYPEAANEYGSRRMLVSLDTLQSQAEMMRSLKMMRSLLDAYPGDYEAAEEYAGLAVLLDTAQESVRVLRIVDSLHPERTQNLIMLARIYSMMNDYGNAIAALDSFEKREGENTQVAVVRLSLRLADGDTITAINDINKIIAAHPGDPEYLLVKGNLYQFMAQPDSAIKYFRHAERLEPTSAEPKLALAEAYKAAGDSVNYDLKTYEALLTDGLEMEQKVEILSSYLQDLINNKADTIRGDSLFRVVKRQYPHEADVLDLAARYNAAKGNSAAAIENISYAIDQNQSNPMYWAQLMQYQIQGDKYKDAMETYHRAVPHIPEGDNSLKLLYASAAQLDKQYDTVVNVYTDMMRDLVPTINPRDSLDMTRFHALNMQGLSYISACFSGIGDAYQGAGDTIAAFDAYEKAIALDDNNSLALNNYAYYLSQVPGADLEKAKSMSERSLKDNPDNTTFLDTYAWILFMLRQYKEALDVQQKVVDSAEANDENDPAVYSHFGDILFMNGRPEDALKYWKKALEADKLHTLTEKELRLLRKKIEHKTFFYE